MRKLALWACLLSASVSYGNEYKVRSGDTVESIANKLGTSAAAIRKANPGLKERQLQIGKKLRIPSSEKSAPSAKAKKQKAAVSRNTTKYTVQSGENNWDLARRFGIKVGELESLNGRDLSRLRPGDQIVVPKRAAAKTVAANSKSKSSESTSAPKLASTHARVKGDRVTVRKSSSTDSARVASVEEGLLGKIVSQRDGWCKMAFADGTEGWVKTSYLNPAKAPKPTKQLVAKKAKPESKPEPKKPDQVLAVNANVNSSRSEEVKAEPKKKPEPKPTPTTTRAGTRSSNGVVSTAKALLGTPYVWGGTSRGGFDCSGFVGYVMRQAGISLPRTSAEQARKGSYVSRSELRTGDLVFFNTRGSRISHVGMYLNSGQFIHASSGGGRVRIDSLSKSYYANRYVTARRVGNFDSVSKAVEDVKRQLEEIGELPKPADKPEVKVQPGADEVGK